MKLFETHIQVSDLERAMRFYGDMLGLELGLKEESRRIAFYWMGGWGKTMLGLWEQNSGAIVSRHFAFEIAEHEMAGAIRSLSQASIETRNFFGEVTQIPTVFGWMPAVSIYFSDPDGNELEYLAMLDGPPRPELGVITWPEWQKAKNSS